MRSGKPLRLLKKRLPILNWLPKYNLHDAVGDFIAGITVGLTLIPQSLAYASLAGLSPQYGLYSAFAGSIVYIFFGLCKEINIGPTALLSLLTLTYTHNTSPDMAVLLCFLSGVVILMCGQLQLGFLVQFVSVPVVAGFTSAAAIIIASSQLKGLLGIKFTSNGFIDTWTKLFQQIHKTKNNDLAMGLTCIITLLILRKIKDIKFSSESTWGSSSNIKVISTIVWFLSTARNALVVIICTIVAYLSSKDEEEIFILTGDIQQGLPAMSLPPMHTTYNNKTINFIEMCSHLKVGIIIVPLIAILGNVAIAKAFSSGSIFDATQEMTALGLCNIFGSLFQSMPVNGSFSRSAVSNQSGVRTPLAGLYTGVLVILSLSLLTPYFHYIPKATLSAVIICAVIFMVEVKMILPIWRTNKRDIVPALVTFFVSLVVGVEIGIVSGVSVDIVIVLYFNARPAITINKVKDSAGFEYLLVTPNSGLLFPAIDYLRDSVSNFGNNCDKTSESCPVVLDLKNISRVDFTAARGISSLIEDLKKTNRPIVFLNLNTEVDKIFDGVSGFVRVNSYEELPQILAGLHKNEIHVNDISLEVLNNEKKQQPETRNTKL